MGLKRSISNKPLLTCLFVLLLKKEGSCKQTKEKKSSYNDKYLCVYGVRNPSHSIRDLGVCQSADPVLQSHEHLTIHRPPSSKTNSQLWWKTSYISTGGCKLLAFFFFSFSNPKENRSFIKW